MGALYSKLMKSTAKTGGSASNKTPEYPLASNDKVFLLIDYTYSFVYFLISFVLLFALSQFEISEQAVCFVTLALIYTIVTLSLTTQSTIFIILEIIVWATLIELLSKLNFDSFAWILVFIIPMISIIQSLYYIVFYLEYK